MENQEVSYHKGGLNGYVPSQFTAPEGFQVAWQNEVAGAWKFANCPIEGGKIPGAKLVSTTANKINSENQQLEQVGDLYIDIDRKFQINEACKSAALIADYLMSLGVHEDDIHIYFSGGKGLHIRVPHKCFAGAL